MKNYKMKKNEKIDMKGNFHVLQMKQNEDFMRFSNSHAYRYYINVNIYAH